ncbi:hypothetical protein Emed_003886 [Eimeria media]
MKFGSKFRSYAVPEWQRHYVDYQGLKAVLKQQQKRIEASKAPPSTYLTKLLLARWDSSTESRHVDASPQSLPLPALMGPPGSRVVPTREGPSPITGGVGAPQEEKGGRGWSQPSRQSRGREGSVLAEPLLQQQEQHEQAEYRSDGEAASGRGGGVFGGVAEGEPDRGRANLQAECLEEFDAAVEREKRKVAAFFKEELGFLEDKLRAVSAELKAFSAARRRRVSLSESADASDSPSGAQKNKRNRADTPAVSAPAGAAAACFPGDKETSSEDAAYLRRLERILLLLLDTLDKLEVYRRLNLLAFWKALKKRDKQLGLEAGKALKDFDGITAFFKQELRIPPKTRRLARNLYRQVAGEDSDLPLDVFPLRTAEGLSMGQFHQEARVWFLAGCLAVLLLLTMCLLSLPMPPSTSFDYGGLMAVFPLFRLAFAWSFVWLSTASAMAIMERYGVNYRFLLDLAPRGQASSISFFSFAALHFVATTGTVALYLADSKLRPRCLCCCCCCFAAAAALLLLHSLVPDYLSGRYHLYPLGLLLLQAIFLLIPSRALSYKARKQVLAVFFSVLQAGVFAVGDVKLVANIIGDVLTSLAKPLGDFQYLLCYLSTLVSLRCSGDALFRPLLLGLPFYLRLCQCLIRFRCSEPGGGLIHLMNMSKYACGILVLITTNVPWCDAALERLDLGVSVYAMCLLWVFSYALGSLFMLYWDVRVDWGLLPTPDRFVRMQGRLMYPPWLYGAIAVTNVMGRLTWAMTLMPISIVGNKSLSGNLVLLFISVIEILRRGAWVVLRLENEHVNNSSQFRAILWVPPLHQTRLEMLEGDPLMQTASVSACQLPSEASSRRPINQGDPGGPSSGLSVLA